MKAMPDPYGDLEENIYPYFEPFGSVFIGFRGFGRDSKFPSKISDNIVDGKYKAGIHRIVNHSNLSSDNLFFCLES